ncbi:hypothetical protein SUGI_0405460 [Cryptomeria japonica]|nr:hypothetical protein SUGI_0405460 [Cryptomeria japonica]
MKGIEESNKINSSNKGNDKNNNGEGQSALRKGPWMAEEDDILVEYVRKYGPRDWSSIRTKGLLPRTGKSCRLRWVNKLKPDLKRSKFSLEEEKIVVEMQENLGNKWAKIASYLPGRTDNDVKNFWSTRQKRILRSLQHLEPQTEGVIHLSSLDYLSDFSNLKVEVPTPLQAIPFEATTPLHSFSNEMCSSDIDDMVMVKSPDLVESDPLLMDTELESFQKVMSDDNRQGSIMSPALSNNIIRSPKIKQKRLQKHHIADLSFTKRQQKHKLSIAVASFKTEVSEAKLLPDIPSTSFDQSNGSHDLGIDLYIDPNDTNILDVLLQPNKKNTFCNSQLPQSSSLNVKDEDSSTPNSVLAGFPADLFDSLEPLTLSPSTIDWWDSRFCEERNVWAISKEISCEFERKWNFS